MNFTKTNLDKWQAVVNMKRLCELKLVPARFSVVDIVLYDWIAFSISKALGSNLT